MIQLSRPQLPQRALDQLLKYQNSVGDIAEYEKKTLFAKEDFSRKNTNRNATFKAVKTALRTMAGAGGRCHFCEDSQADEVEHLLPKDVYPEQCYNWNNYFYVCGTCNVPKGNKCAVINTESMTLIPIVRPKNQPVLPPPTGAIAIIDQVAENPLDFLILDIQDSFVFSELHDEGTVGFLKAQFTLETLRLNIRPSLIKQRGLAFHNFHLRLEEYGREKNSASSDDDKLKKMITAIKELSHQTVWQEMKRQHRQIPELARLFRNTPEALEW